MADATHKRAIINRAILIFSAGTTGAARVLFEDGDMDTTYFSDPHANVPSTRKDILVSCIAYEQVLKRILIDLKPEFAKQYADLGHEIRINKEHGDWSYIFELPSDFLWLIAQIDQTDIKKEYKAVVKYFREYAHIVTGSDDQTYYCSTAHISVDDTSDGEPPDDDGDSNWTLYDEDNIGADWVEGWSYKASETGRLLLTNNYSNYPSTTVDESIDSAFIEYISYVQAGINDEPEYYSEDFCNAFATRLGAELALAIGKDYKRRLELISEYENIAKPNFFENEAEREHIPERISIFTNSKNLRLP
jgi:hypothetical protein